VKISRERSCPNKWFNKRPSGAGLSLTGFAKKVYKTIISIPLGEARSYKWVARMAGRPKAYRAVGQILKNNPCPLIIPCHRVVNSGKGRGGYIFGRRSKNELLDLEREIKQCIIGSKK
jgi:O-6-methylguanine DNA methyltransferase